ncbi:hypothetical protein ACTXT7_009052 [Hymenolepis weldensis]
MGRKLRTVHEAMLLKKTLPDRKRERKKNGFTVNTPVYVRDYLLGRQWTAMIITKSHEIIIYDVGVGKDMWVRHYNQLQQRLAEPITDQLWFRRAQYDDTVQLYRSMRCEATFLEKAIFKEFYVTDPNTNLMT